MGRPRPRAAKTWMFLLLLGEAWAGHSRAQENKVLGGQECRPHSQPWQAALFQGKQLLCGGVLIGGNWILTAAHCKKPKYTVRLGDHSLQKKDGPEQEIPVVQSIPHPCYNSSDVEDHNHDLMLLQLRDQASLGPKVKPISLADHCTQPGQMCIISGWGTVTSPRVKTLGLSSESQGTSPGSGKIGIRVPACLAPALNASDETVCCCRNTHARKSKNFPDTLNCAEVKIFPQKKCEDAYPGQITDGMVCAGSSKGADTCQGDSGGPLVCNGALQGITSWGSDPCGRSDRPGVYTNICRYLDWIKKTIGSKG
nr:kallikrein-8 isoform X1 [Macaca fascicularis]XP_045235573.1 kallikrein-8 isoform X1 [Macaca fascicularis]XP_045235574.1 kallikrein-8 isoform X1 [Macaca fascicularis]